MLEWFNQIKTQTLYCYIYKEHTKNVVWEMLTKNSFLMKNSALQKYFHILQNMMDMNQINLELFMGNLKEIEDNDLVFEIEDIETEMLCIKENIVIERRALKNYFSLVEHVRKNILPEEYLSDFEKKNAKYIKDMQYNAEEFISLYESESYSLEKNVKK